MLRSDLSVADVAASFQKALVDVLVEKSVRAAKEYHVTEILLAGGVSANQALRKEMRARSDLPVRYPPLNLCTDNAAMIAAAAHYRFWPGCAAVWTWTSNRCGRSRARRMLANHSAILYSDLVMRLRISATPCPLSSGGKPSRSGSA